MYQVTLAGVGHRAESLGWKVTGGRLAFLLGPEGQGLWAQGALCLVPRGQAFPGESLQGATVALSKQGPGGNTRCRVSQEGVSAPRRHRRRALPSFMPSLGPWPEHPGARGPTSPVVPPPALAAQGGIHAR